MACVENMTIFWYICHSRVFVSILICIFLLRLQVVGVYSREFIPKGTRFGPLQGDIFTKDSVPKGADRKYFWRVSQIKVKSNIIAIRYRIYIFTYLKLCLATATHNFKWVKISLLKFVYFETKHLQILMFKHTFCSHWFHLIIKHIKEDIVVLSVKVKTHVFFKPYHAPFGGCWRRISW